VQGATQVLQQERAAEKAPPRSAPCFSAETGRPTCQDIIPNNGDNFKWNIYIFL